jgi:hypothetical protein
MNIAVLVPFYNEENNLIFFIKEWEKFLYKKKELKNRLFFFFIDDGSTDQSVKSIYLNAKKLKFKIFKKKNSGHGDSCKFGYNLIINNYKKFDFILQIDSDNQCNPKYIVSFYNLLKKHNYNFIFGHRNKREDGLWRYLTSKIMSLIFFLKKFVYIKDLNTPYRIMKINNLKEILSNININSRYKDIKLYNCVLSWEIQKKYTIHWVKINFRKRYYGGSKFNLIKMLAMFLNFIIKI